MLNKEEILEKLNSLIRGKGRSNLLFKREIQDIIDEAELPDEMTAEERMALE